MAKLVVLSAGLAGRSEELKVDKTTIGRVEDNTFQIAEPSVSSHHCEVFLRGTDVVVKDLQSTNGTFINGEKITESVLKPGQVLRLGQVEIRLENGAPPSASAPATAAPAGSASSKKSLDHTVAMPRGVSLDELEQGPRATGFDTSSKAFSKKTNQTNRWFLIVGIIVFCVISLVILWTLSQVKK
jgi:predicted component of type VI protein secretion system